ncbi:MAG: hypothetical protein IPN82_06155 [Chitinophagaceae bacterium]|nr:hypothetical protein [Chitinophagaceae bacterium]MBK8606416.1 hypothetical protein [Chitinophagaceae bacterium]MBP6476484.1 hypothetical protein [Chitinophagaceae bacterium]MBP7107759.1 hypothetical protein [Chitinophagaceae bacterium]MBP7314368.1 hypothetical protein [Chitinophagaceae bacterium]
MNCDLNEFLCSFEEAIDNSTTIILNTAQKLIARPFIKQRMSFVLNRNRYDRRERIIRPEKREAIY